MHYKKAPFVCILMVTLFLIVFAGCTPDKDKQNAQPMGPMYEGAQPGAITWEHVNPDGSKEYHYQNPDGSAGGGIELD